MLRISLFVELLRTRPLLVFWTAALAQGALWTLVPTLFYTAPPGDLPQVLAIGQEFQFGTYFGPPLGHWLAEIAYVTGGLFGVFLLSQVCVVVTYWAVFALGRLIVGDKHAVMAVLLMAGVSVFTVPTPDFGPGVLAMALWALILLHTWRAIGEGRRRYWLLCGLEIGLLLLTTYEGFILVGLVAVFMLLDARLRAQLLFMEPWIGGIIALMVFFPHLIWIDQVGGVTLAGRASISINLWSWGHLLVMLIVGHAGLAVLVLLGRGFTLSRSGPALEIERSPIDPMARKFVYFFALTPALAVGLLAVITSRVDFAAGPLVVLSGLAVIVAAGDRIRIAHHRLIGFAWAALLVLPPLIVAVSVPLLPWTLGIDLRVSQPAAEMGRFFAESFERRTGRPLAIVAGDARIAALVALAAPSRPSLYLDLTPERSSWVRRQDIAEKGAVVVWPATDTRGTPPAAIRERYPDLVPEVPPRAFSRRFQGWLPLTRVGWAVIRPRSAR